MKILIEKLLEYCEERDCPGCVFKDICDSVNLKLGPTEWSKEDCNTFCKLVMEDGKK